MSIPFRARSRSAVIARRDRNRHFHGGLSGNVQKTTQNSNSSIDNTSQARTKGIWDAATGAANAGPGAPITGASDAYGNMVQGGTRAFNALTGDAAAQKQFMNPYQQNVIDQNNIGWDKINAQTVNRTNDMATKASAFGGSRHGVAEGVALSNNAAAQAAQNANLFNSGFDQTQARAAAAAQLGFNAAGANANLGFQGVGSPDLWRLQQLKAGYMGPQGQQSSGAQTTFGGNVGLGWGLGG